MDLKYRRKALFYITFCLFNFFSMSVFAQGENPSPPEIIVKLKDTNKISAKSLDNTSKDIGKPIFRKVGPKAGETVEDLLNRYRNDPSVEYAELNVPWSMQFIPNDPYYGSQWAFPKINMPQAWETSRGSSQVVVAVVDTGVDIYHPDLAGRMIDGYNAITGEEGNYYANDDQGHGTHIAGTIGASINNGIGIAGIADKVSIMPVKVLDNTGAGWTADIAEGIIWAADHNANVINLSLGSDERSIAVEDAVAYAYGKGAIVVASAGNSGRRGVLFPAASPHVIGVSATNDVDFLSTSSSYGAEVDLSAPGASIYSTKWINGVSGYGSLSGTSMAASFVSGVAALILSTHPELTNDQIETALKESAYDLGVSGWDEKFGYGRLDTYSALKYAEENYVPDNYDARFDLNWDGHINLTDIFLLSNHYGKKVENSLVDFNYDGVIDLYDIVAMSRNL